MKEEILKGERKYLIIPMPKYMELMQELTQEELTQVVHKGRVAAYDAGDYTEDQMLDHSNNVMEDIRDFLLMENSIDNLNTLRQSILN